MYTLFTFVTMKCNTCNKPTSFEPGLYDKPLECSCNCNTPVKKTRKPRTKKVKDEE